MRGDCAEDKPKTPTSGDTNPKKQYGTRKPSLSLVPKTAMLGLSKVMELGAKKYGPYNWRENAVDALTYIDAIHRHMACFESGEDEDAESHVSDLLHVMACCAIMIDAMECGMFVDNRYKSSVVLETLQRLTVKD